MEWQNMLFVKCQYIVEYHPLDDDKASVSVDVDKYSFSSVNGWINERIQLYAPSDTSPTLNRIFNNTSMTITNTLKYHPDNTLAL